MRSGIKQVAEHAGVSIATVSHVINNTRYVSDEIKRKVYEAMEELDYRPNSAARSLRSQKSNTIGLIVPVLPSDTSNFFFMMVAQGIQFTLKQHGYHLLLSNNTTEQIEDEQEQIKLFNSKLIDGLFIASIAEDVSYLNEIVRSNYPVVFIDRKPAGYNGDSVLADGLGGAYEAVKTLIAKGHRRIGLLTGELGITTSNERYEGYQKALADHGIPWDPSIVKVAESNFESGYEGVKALLAEHDITALFIANNVLTMGAMRYIQERRIQIPAELAVIGFDDYDWTQITSPPLTVIRQPSYEIGVKAAEIMLKRIENPSAGSKEYRLPTALIMRDSC
ncbi:LacI family DNA-binding transcriptional regulator [Paenibacillus sedimenti]|uniref:LacI family DNA-binding transcriptional regulator n=1 Tax=Paenibacillus sedimenti TaxID=2770274 RepID=A0A926KQI4_9BACL|nr:LacI family DNA-binding transcriptional regulator [Paenibacillus sedimenti]MBD0380225.1 LacI family DNA-binding transcriptional regulator [Paenibacillus sedimenti]